MRDEAEEQRRGDREPEEHQHRRLELVYRDLDEEVRRAPDRGQDAEQRPVGARQAGSGSRRRRRRAAPVPNATPVSTSASPATAVHRSGSSSSTTPYTRASAGTRYVTRIARDAPTPAISPK